MDSTSEHLKQLCTLLFHKDNYSEYDNYDHRWKQSDWFNIMNSMQVANVLKKGKYINVNDVTEIKSDSVLMWHNVT